MARKINTSILRVFLPIDPPIPQEQLGRLRRAWFESLATRDTGWRMPVFKETADPNAIPVLDFTPTDD